MKFQIALTSAGSTNHNQQPYPLAFQEEVTIEEKFQRYPLLPQSAQDANEDRFRSVGFNHRVSENGDLLRNMKVTRWFIEINSLDELVALAKEAEKENPERGIVFDGETIEIYDSYRE